MLQRYIKIFYQKVKINFFIRKLLFIFAEIKYETMEAKELRISNLVHLIADGHENEPDLLIWELEDYEFYENKMEYIKPIPLTEEWLLKLPKKLTYPTWIKYLHELQNWYYWNNEKKELHINL